MRPAWLCRAAVKNGPNTAARAQSLDHLPEPANARPYKPTAFAYGNGFQSMPRDAFAIYFAGVGIHNVAIFPAAANHAVSDGLPHHHGISQ